MKKLNINAIINIGKRLIGKGKIKTPKSGNKVKIAGILSSLGGVTQLLATDDTEALANNVINKAGGAIESTQQLIEASKEIGASEQPIIAVIMIGVGIGMYLGGQFQTNGAVGDPGDDPINDPDPDPPTNP